LCIQPDWLREGQADYKNCGKFRNLHMVILYRSLREKLSQTIVSIKVGGGQINSIDEEVESAARSESFSFRKYDVELRRGDSQ
jgi:hypothetical protein